MKTPIKIASLSSDATQPWKHARPRPHLTAMPRGGKEAYRALKNAGFKPFLVQWTSFMVGLPEHLKADQPGWDQCVEFHKAMKGIYLHRDNVVCYMAPRTGWVWDVLSQGAGLQRCGEPVGFTAWLHRQQPVLPEGK